MTTLTSVLLFSPCNRDQEIEGNADDSSVVDFFLGESMARAGKKMSVIRWKRLEEMASMILIVEDEGVLRAMASEMLKILGYSVAAVASGEEAVFYLETESGPSCHARHAAGTRNKWQGAL